MTGNPTLDLADCVAACPAPACAGFTFRDANRKYEGAPAKCFLRSVIALDECDTSMDVSTGRVGDMWVRAPPAAPSFPGWERVPDTFCMEGWGATDYLFVGQRVASAAGPPVARLAICGHGAWLQ